MKKTLLVLLFISLFMVGCKKNDEEILFTLEQTTYNIGLGDTITPKITLLVNDIWSEINDNPDILEHSANGFTAIGEGDATITYQMRDQVVIVHVHVGPSRTYSIDGNSTVLVGSESTYNLLFAEERVDDATWRVVESELASINDEGVLTPLFPGNITIQAIVDDEIVKEYSVRIDTISFETDSTALVGEIRTLVVEVAGNPLTWTSSNPLVATVDNTGFVQFIGVGVTSIKVAVTDQPTICYEQSIYVSERDNLGVDQIIVDQTIDDLNGTIIFYDGLIYHSYVNAFSTITAAMEAADEDSIIILTPGIYTEDIRISKSHLRLVGPNMDVDPTNSERSDEAIIKGKVRIGSQISHLTINGLTFAEDSTITLEGQATLFTFVNNIVRDTTQTVAAWVEQGTYTGGFLVFRSGSKNSDEVVIENNLFSTIGDVGINVNQMDNFKVINNTFDGFTRDAIRMSNGIVSKSSQWLFRNNRFKNGLYNGLFFRTYGTNTGAIEHIVSIFDNTFEAVGQTNVLFSGAVSFRNYQEGLTSVNISYNEFKNCNNYILLRNNAVTANQPNFHAFVNYNSFIGVPVSYYLRNKNTTDTSSTNPSNILLVNNYYGLNGGTSVDVTLHQAKFMGASGEVTTITQEALASVPRVYGSNLVHIDTTPMVIAKEGVTFASNNLSLFTVDSTGVITPLQEGAGTLSVSNGTYVNSFPVVVGKSLNIDYIYLLLQTAYGEEGFHEGTNNDTKYGTWYGLPNQAWCAMFVSWCSNQAGISTTIIPKYASVSVGMDWFINKGLFQYKERYVPKTGDLIFFKSDGASHTGIVISCDGTTVYTIEGNTSDMVAKRSYPLMYSKITGYGLPEYPSYEGTPYVFDISGATDGDGHSTR